jgi:hypothetical protein
MSKEQIVEQIEKSFNEHKGTNEAIDDAAFYIAAKFKQEYAAQPHTSNINTELIQAAKQYREVFLTEIDRQEWNTEMRTTAESLIIIYDQIIQAMKAQYHTSNVTDVAKELFKDSKPLGDEESEILERAYNKNVKTERTIGKTKDLTDDEIDNRVERELSYVHEAVRSHDFDLGFRTGCLSRILDGDGLPIKLKKSEKLEEGDIFLWRSAMSGRFEIHTFHSDSGYGAKTFTGYNEKDGSSEIINYSGICGVLVCDEPAPLPKSPTT